MKTNTTIQAAIGTFKDIVIALFVAVAVVSAVAFSSLAMANDLTLDPTIEGQKVLTVVCTYPIEREDNTPIAVNEIAKVTFHVKKQGDSDSLYAPAGENTAACKQVYDMTQVPDGVYVYAAKVIDTDGRESVYSTGVVNAVVKRKANPNAPTGLTGSLS